MTNERNSLKAGLFIVVSVALIVFVVVGIKGLSRFVEPTQRHQVRFKLSDDIGGLANGDDVRIGGAKVGTVRDIELDTESENPGIVITFQIPKKFQVRRDANVTIQTTVTGVSVLNIESLGSRQAQQLAEGEMITGMPGASIATLTAKARDLVPELTAAVRDIRTSTIPKVNATVDTYKTTGESATDLIKYAKSKVDPIIDRYNAFAEKGRFALDQAGTLFSDVKSDFRTTITNLAAATTSVKDKLPGILEKADGTLAKIQTALDSTNEALVDIKKVAENTRDATAHARSILTNNRSRIDAMIVSLKTASDNLKFATAEIRRSPWRLLYKPAPDEMGNLNLYDSARHFAEGASAMQDAAEALRDAAKDPNADPQQIQKLVETLDSSFQNFKSVEGELWKQVK